jgi:hypothetical protein
VTTIVVAKTAVGGSSIVSPINVKDDRWIALESNPE